MKKGWVVAGLIAWLLLAGQVWAEEKIKVGVLNVQKVLFESEAGKKAKDELGAKQKVLQDKVNKKQDEMQKLRQELDKKSAVLSTAAREEKEREYQKEVQAVQQMFEDARFEMQQAERQASEPLLNNLQKVIDKYGQEQGFTMIFDLTRGSIVYNTDSIDITDKVLETFNKTMKETPAKETKSTKETKSKK